jgi:hypothetical protein
LRECLFLLAHGVPFDVAFGLDDITRTGWAIMFSEMESSRKFNWNHMSFEEGG